MALEIQDWQEQLALTQGDPAVHIRYVRVSVFDGHGLFVSEIPPGEANTGHFHTDAAEIYHITKGRGTMLSQSVADLGTTITATCQDVREGMSIHIPAQVVHRLVNSGGEPLTFLFECPLSHMDPQHPMRTVIEHFGDTSSSGI